MALIKVAIQHSSMPPGKLINKGFSVNALGKSLAHSHICKYIGAVAQTLIVTISVINVQDTKIQMPPLVALPNGNLHVRGEKIIGLNQGSEFLRISGIVRPQDVDSNNVVQSTKLANARIYYGGGGAIAEANTKGWLSRFFDSPVFPF